MDKGQRIKQNLIIANCLGKKPWLEVEYIEKEFGFKHTPSYAGGTKKEHILDLLSVASKEDIIELAKHLDCYLGYEVAQDNNLSKDTNLNIWGDKKLRIFLSHISKHKKFVVNLKTQLENFGISSFVAHEDIHPNTEWIKQIEFALASCNLLVALIHDKFHDSEWTDQEIGFVMGREIPVFSVRLGSDPRGFISQFQAIKCSDSSPESVARAIFISALSCKKTAEEAGLCLIMALVNSNNFDSSNNLAKHLKEIKDINPEWPDLLSVAFKKNTQLYWARDVQEPFNSFFKKAGRVDLAGIKAQPF